MNLKELSSLLGLSQTTVSRALNGYSDVKASTRARVVAAAKEHNYLPNSRAQALATGRAMSIGHVIPRTAQHELVNTIFADFIAGASEAYAARGYDLRMVTVKDVDEFATYERLANTGAVDGFMLHGPTRDDKRIQLLNDLKVPFILHGRSSDCNQPYSWLDVNNRSAFKRAVDLLLDLGHTRVALLNGDENMDFAIRRREGFTLAHEQRGLEIDPSLMHSNEMSEPYGFETTRQLMALDAPPTAIVASALIPALGIQRAAHELGLKIGRDLSVICFDDALSYFPNGSGAPLFTATRSSVRDAGRRCGTLLIDRIEAADDTPVVTELWEAELVIGGSTGPNLAGMPRREA
jgi:LacI family transcriptional regulator